MKTLVAQSKLETKLLYRDKSALFWILAFPVFIIVLFGLIYEGIGETWEDIGAPINYLMPAIIVMALISTCIMGIVPDFVEQREKGIYRRLSLTPLKRFSLIGGQLVNRYLVVLIQAIILIAIGIGVFGARIDGNYLLFWLVLSLGAISFMALGFALIALVKSSKGATALSMIPFFILMFLGGIFIPIEQMPEFLQPICEALPSTNLNDALRMVALDQAGIADVLRELLILLGWLVGCLVLSVKLFKWE